MLAKWFSTQWRRKVPGGAAGLQNQSGGRKVPGGFDSLPSPPSIGTEPRRCLAIYSFGGKFRRVSSIVGDE